ncbi:MAG: SpoIIE family protein phosphatase [Desulfobacterales bacterium]
MQHILKKGYNRELEEKKRLASTTAFVLAVLLSMIIAAVYLNNIIMWAGFPDFGFGFRTASGIKTVGVVTDPGRKAGMKVGDTIVAVNGKTFGNIEEFRSAMNREPGESNEYILERNGKRIKVNITNQPQGIKTSFEKSGFPFVLGFVYTVIGIIVFMMKPHQRSSWIFFIFSFTFGLFLTFLYKSGVMEPLFLEDLNIFAFVFTPAAFIHLAFCFPEERRFLKKYPYVQLLPYLFAALLFILVRSATHNIMDVPAAWLGLIVIYMAVGVLWFLGSCFQLRLTSASEIVKARSRMILLGFAISASLPLLDFIINSLFNLYIMPSFNYYLPFFVIFPLSIGYSIVKHDLFDFDAIIKRTYGYVLTTGAIAWIYVVFVFVSEAAFEKFGTTRSPLSSLVFVLGVAFFINPVRNRAQKFIDRTFYRLEYDYQDTVQKISETMRSLLKLDEIGKSIMDTALKTMFIDTGCVILLNRENQIYECLIAQGSREPGRNEGRTKTVRTVKNAVNLREQQGVRYSFQTAKFKNTRQDSQRRHFPDFKLPAGEIFIQKMLKRKKEATIYDVQEDPFFQDCRAACADVFNKLQAILVVPLIYEDRLTGLISLGEKKSGKFYRKEDINLLNTLANQGAVAIENARMIEEIIEKERMEEELSIARDLQISMLPAECPQIDGFEIAACSIAARQVGGDFYDFIKIGENKTGMVIGDVIGKSVSGALVMSASRSVFRMLSEEQISVGEIMNRANRRTRQDIKPGMFVALLYAVLNSKDKTLSLCSAGQTQPIYWSPKKGAARLVETLGDNFPLGIIGDADYRETLLHLGNGDKVVFYTDGIVETMNDKHEIFGFDRLLELVQEAGTTTAEALRKKILFKINEFSAGIDPHDDLTLIVLNAAYGQ